MFSFFGEECSVLLYKRGTLFASFFQNYFAILSLRHVYIPLLDVMQSTFGQSHKEGMTLVRLHIFAESEDFQIHLVSLT